MFYLAGANHNKQPHETFINGIHNFFGGGQIYGNQYQGVIKIRKTYERKEARED